MTLTHFIPELWSASILENFRRDTVLVGMANREYEKAFTAGSKIHIPGIVDVKVKDYKTGAVTASGGTKVPRTTVPDAVESTGIEITIDQEKSFDFLVDDIDAAQANQSLDAYTKSAAAALVEDAETFLTAMLTSKGTAVTGIANPTNWETAYGAILKLRGKLSAEKVPAMDRVLLINAAFEEFLLSDGSKLTSFDKSNMTDGLREATIGPQAVRGLRVPGREDRVDARGADLRRSRSRPSRLRRRSPAPEGDPGLQGGMMQVKGENGITFELADEVATAMITAGILEETTSDEASKKSKK